jgi:hypothetical protein
MEMPDCANTTEENVLHGWDYATDSSKKNLCENVADKRNVSATLGDAVPNNTQTVYFIKPDFSEVCKFELLFQ